MEAKMKSIFSILFPRSEEGVNNNIITGLNLHHRVKRKKECVRSVHTIKDHNLAGIIANFSSLLAIFCFASNSRVLTFFIYLLLGAENMSNNNVRVQPYEIQLSLDLTIRPQSVHFYNV